MNFEEFIEYIKNTPVLSDEYKADLLIEAKNYSPDLLQKIIIIIYNSELELIKLDKKLQKQQNDVLKETIKNEEEEDRKNAEIEIDKLFEL